MEINYVTQKQIQRLTSDIEFYKQKNSLSEKNLNSELIGLKNEYVSNFNSIIKWDNSANSSHSIKLQNFSDFKHINDLYILAQPLVGNKRTKQAKDYNDIKEILGTFGKLENRMMFLIQELSGFEKTEPKFHDIVEKRREENMNNNIILGQKLQMKSNF